MIRSKVIIVARWDDPHVPLIRDLLDSSGHAVYWLRLGLDRSEYEVDSVGPNIQIRESRIKYDSTLFSESKVIYLPFAVNSPPYVEGCITDFSKREWNSVFDSAIMQWWSASDNDNWLMHTGAAILQNQKPYLLSRAQEIARSLQVPNLAVASGLKNESHPHDGGRLVAKAINMWEEVGPSKYFNTTLLSGDYISKIAEEGLSTPSMFQKYIPHETELRVYYCHGKFTIVKIRPNVEQVDFRLLSTENANATVVEEFEYRQIADDICRLSIDLELNYLACDVIPAEGDVKTDYLLDINPIGSWQYFDSEFGLNITASLLSSFMEDKL